MFGPSRLFGYLTWVSFAYGTILFALAVSAWRDSKSYAWLGYDTFSVIFGCMAVYQWGRAVYYFANGPERLLVEVQRTLIRLSRWRCFASERVQAIIIDDFGDIASMLGFIVDGREMFLGELTAVEDVGDVAQKLGEFLEVPVQRRQQVR